MDCVVLAVAAYLQAAMLVRCTGALISKVELPSPPPSASPIADPPRTHGAASILFDPGVRSGCDGMSVSILSESSDREASLASVRAGSGTRLVRVGTRLGTSEVVRIGGSGVTLSAGSALCRVPLGPPGKDAEPAPISVQRSVRDSVLRDPRRLLGGARVELERERGRITGVRIAQLAPGSLLERLGLAAGDRVLRVNDVAVVDPADALRAWAKLSRAEAFELSIERAGRARTLQIGVR